MRAKMGTVVPKKGTTVHLRADQAAYHEAVKTAMRWTGASERTVKYWLSGERGPSGEHLIVLAQHSGTVLLTILAMAERLADRRHRCACCPERLLVLQNLGQKPSLSEVS